MATQIYPGEVGEIWGSAQGISTDISTFRLNPKTSQITLQPMEFSSATAEFKYYFCPYGRIFDNSPQDLDHIQSATSSNSLEDVTAIYVGAPWPFNALAVTLAVPNDVASVMTVEYVNAIGADGFAQFEEVENLADGTDNSGDSFGTSGIINWDIPRDWVRAKINTNRGATSLYWAVINFSAPLAAATDIMLLNIIKTDTDPFACLSNGTSLTVSTRVSLGGYALVNYCMSTGTGVLLVTEAAAPGQGQDLSAVIEE